MIFGFQPTENFNFYGGGVYQTIKGNVHLRGSAYSVYNGYDASIPEDGAAGWLAGAAFQIPEIALKASITYRSEINHKIDADETIAMADAITANASMLGGVIQKLVASGQLTPAKATAIQQTIGKAVAANQLESKTKLLHHSLLTLISKQVSWQIQLRLPMYAG